MPPSLLPPKRQAKPKHHRWNRPDGPALMREALGKSSPLLGMLGLYRGCCGWPLLFFGDAPYPGSDVGVCRGETILYCEGPRSRDWLFSFSRVQLAEFGRYLGLKRIPILLFAGSSTGNHDGDSLAARMRFFCAVRWPAYSFWGVLR